MNITHMKKLLDYLIYGLSNSTNESQKSIFYQALTQLFDLYQKNDKMHVDEKFHTWLIKLRLDYDTAYSEDNFTYNFIDDSEIKKAYEAYEPISIPDRQKNYKQIFMTLDGILAHFPK